MEGGGGRRGHESTSLRSCTDLHLAEHGVVSDAADASRREKAI